MKYFWIILLTILLLLPCHAGSAEVKWEIKEAFKLPVSPIDIKFSKDGERIYILSEDGHLLVYTSSGGLQNKFFVGKDFDRIEPGMEETSLFLISRANKVIMRIEIGHSDTIDFSGSPMKGDASAPVTIVIFEDFQCAYCAKVATILDHVHELYPEKVKIVFKNFPLSGHKYSVKAAIAAMAAHQKGKFWEFHDRLFENYDQLDDEKILEIRKEFGFDTPEFEAILNSDEIKNRIRQDIIHGNALGIEGTPAVFIDGRKLKKRTMDDFIKAVDAALAAEK